MADPALAYDYDSDSRWQRYVATLEFPGGQPTAEQLQRKKRLWYKRNIDNAYQVPAQSPKAATSNTPQSVPSSGSSLPGQDNAEDTHSQATAHSRKQVFAAVARQIKGNPMRTLHLVLTMSSLIGCLLFLLSGGRSLLAYRVAFLLAMASYLENILLAHGRPHWTNQYAYQLSPDPSLHFFVYCVLFFINPPLIVPVVPLLVYGTYNTTDSLRAYADGVATGRQGRTRLGMLLDNNRERAANRTAQLEIYMMAYVVIMAFTGRMSVFSPFLYYHFLRLRSEFDSTTKAIVGPISGAVDRLVDRPSMPNMVKALWNRIRL